MLTAGADMLVGSKVDVASVFCMTVVIMLMLSNQMNNDTSLVLILL